MYIPFPMALRSLVPAHQFHISVKDLSLDPKLTYTRLALVCLYTCISLFLPSVSLFA